MPTIANIQFTDAAARNIEEAGATTADIESDVESIRYGVSEDVLLVACLEGAAEDRREGWRDYVAAIVAAARENDV